MQKTVHVRMHGKYAHQVKVNKRVLQHMKTSVLALVCVICARNTETLS